MRGHVGENMHAGRRKFLKHSFLTLAGLGIAAPLLIKKRMIHSLLNRCPFDGSSVAIADDQPPGETFTPDPIMEIKTPQQREFAGDRPMRAHHALWDKDNYLKSKGGIPAPSENVSVVVVGGGMSGLLAANQIADLKPIVLEQAAQFGGNAKAERWEGAHYSIGAAYINVPEDGSAIAQLLKDLNLVPKFRSETGQNEAITMNGKFSFPFWQGVTDPPRAAEFKKVFDKLITMATSEDGLPAIPPPANQDPEDRKELNRLDNMSFADWTKSTFGQIHPHIEELFHQYCWSAFCADFNEVSAAQAINFLCADLVVIQTVPGGNAGITQALYDRLGKSLPDCSLRAGCLVVDISQDAGGVRVCYEGPDGNLKTVQAKAVVNTAAKFISKVVLTGVPDDQWDAMDTLKYRAYVVGNVLMKSPLKSPGYDVYCLRGQVPGDPKDEIQSRVWTDLTYATWAQDDQGAHGVLSLYRPYAYDGGRKELYQDGAYEKLKADFQNAVPTLVTQIGLDPANIVEIRLSRWGHALPVAAKGLIADGTLERASKPIGRVFFGQQDNWASPCFESAFQCATGAADSARQVASRI